MTRFFIDRTDTPIGEMMLISDQDGALRATLWAEKEARVKEQLSRHYGKALTLVPKRDAGGLTAALKAYFRGELSAIDGLPVAGAGTDFQRAVWAQLRKIPCGTTLSYGELARRIGNPAAVRAVGLANGANPISIVVPCHRVIGANGTLTGFGGGLPRKKWLLAHEAGAGPLFEARP